MILMNLDLAVRSFDGDTLAAGSGVVFAFPVRGTQVIWSTSYASTPSAVSVSIQTSEDLVAWTTIDTTTSTAGETRAINTACRFIKAIVNSSTGGSTLIVRLTASTGNANPSLSISGTVTTSDTDTHAVLGTTTGAAIITDIAGTIQQYLRGLVKLFTTAGTIILGAGSAVIGAVTQSGSWVLSAGSAIIGKVGIDQTTDGTTNKVYVGNTVTVTGATTTIPVALTETLANVSSSATSVTLLASNSSRRGAILFNDSTAILYVKFGATASATSFTYQVFPSQTLTFDLPIYTGVVDGIWASANGAARITEAT